MTWRFQWQVWYRFKKVELVGGLMNSGGALIQNETDIAQQVAKIHTRRIDHARTFDKAV